MTVEEKLMIAENALLFYSSIRFNPRLNSISDIIDTDKGNRASEALRNIGSNLAYLFFDDEDEDD